MRELLDGLADAVVAADAAGRVVYANRAAETLLGWSAAELAGQPIEVTVPERLRLLDGKPFYRRLAERLTDGRAVQAPALRKDGVEIQVEFTAARVGDRTVASLRRLRPLPALDRPDEDDAPAPVELYRLVFDSAPIGIMHFDDRGVITACNAKFCAVIGSPERVLVGLDMRSLPDEKMRETLRTALGGRPARYEGEYHSATARKVTPVHVDFAPILVNGVVVGGVGIVEDISERRQAEDALRRSEAAFRTLIEGAPDAIAVYRDGRFVYVNPTMAQTLGYARADELLGVAVADVLHPDDRAGFVARAAEMMQTQKAALREGRFRKSDGSYVLSEIGLLPIHFDGAEAVIVVGRDVTERKQMEARLALADRLASVGTLAAGVAHEINNPLAYVIASLDMASRKLAAVRAQGGDDAILTQITSALENAREGAERVSTIVRDLRTFSRDDSDRRVLVDLERVLDSTVNMAYYEIKQRARLVKDYGGVSAVWGDESRLGQVFLNLLINAAHAIPEGDVKGHEIRITTRDTNSGQVVVEVRDTGHGIAPELLGRIFEPFVTTKPSGVGTGLGLSICHGIVKALGGEITVESAPGQGSLFRVTLPGRGERPATPPDGTPMIKRKRLLIVDDEPLLARALARELGERHEVVVATSGQQAIEVLLADDRFDLVLCDFHMPDLTGERVYEEIQRARPGVHERFVFMTGALSTRAAQRLERLPNPRLQKPFGLADVEALLARRGRRRKA